MKNKFAIFILTNGRPNKVITVNALLQQNYTGDYYLILDNEDATIPEYKKRYGDEHIIVFDKKKYAGTFDIMDNFSSNKVVVFARNACYDIARSLGLNYFAEFEDDYSSFSYRYENEGELNCCLLNMDTACKLMVDVLDKTGVRTVAFAQGGDLLGGINSTHWRKLTHLRKAMNTFFFKVGEKKDDMIFIGRLNDDVNTYLTLGARGELFITPLYMAIVQEQTQAHSGGNTEAYLTFGTYVKSFYSVMAAPSCCKISTLSSAHQRIHHLIDWIHAVPMIINEKYKKNSV